VDPSSLSAQPAEQVLIRKCNLAMTCKHSAWSCTQSCLVVPGYQEIKVAKYKYCGFPQSLGSAAKLEKAPGVCALLLKVSASQTH